MCQLTSSPSFISEHQSCSTTLFQISWVPSTLFSTCSPPTPTACCFLHIHRYPWTVNSPPAHNILSRNHQTFVAHLMYSASQDGLSLYHILSLGKEGRINCSFWVTYLPTWAGIRQTGHLLRKSRGGFQHGKCTDGKEKVEIERLTL